VLLVTYYLLPITLYSVLVCGCGKQVTHIQVVIIRLLDACYISPGEMSHLPGGDGAYPCWPCLRYLNVLCPCNYHSFMLPYGFTIELYPLFPLPYSLFPILHFPPHSGVGSQRLVGSTALLQLIFDFVFCTTPSIYVQSIQSCPSYRSTSG
jgi:hypothetical protein